MSPDRYVSPPREGVHEDDYRGATVESPRPHKFTAVFKMLLATFILVAVSVALSGWSSINANNAAHDAGNAAADAHNVYTAVQATNSPEAIAARRKQIDDIVAQISVVIDCANEARWRAVVGSLETLLKLPPGSVVITPCNHTAVVPNDGPTSTTTTTPGVGR